MFSFPKLGLTLATTWALLGSGCNHSDPREERLDTIKKKIDSDKEQDNLDAADKAIKEFGGKK